MDRFRFLGNCLPTRLLSQQWVGTLNQWILWEIFQFDECSNERNSAMTRLGKLTVPSHLNEYDISFVS